MKKIIDKMRADLDVLAGARVGSDYWLDGAAMEIGRAIRAAIDAQDTALLNTWSRWLAVLSSRVLMEEPAVAADPAKACADCVSYGKPGGAEGGCAGRDDLAKLYGANHPLRVLPKDGGLSCVRFVRKGM